MSLMSSLTKILPLNPLRQSSFTLGNFKTLLLIFFIKLVKQTSLLLDIHYFNGPRHSYHFNLYSMNGFFVIIEFLSSACEQNRLVRHKQWQTVKTIADNQDNYIQLQTIVCSCSLRRLMSRHTKCCAMTIACLQSGPC